MGNEYEQFALNHPMTIEEADNMYRFIEDFRKQFYENDELGDIMDMICTYYD